MHIIRPSFGGGGTLFYSVMRLMMVALTETCSKLHIIEYIVVF